MLNKKLTCAALVLSLGLSNAVMARGGHGMAYMVSEYDADGDNNVTLEEIQAGRAAEFAANDTDGTVGLSLTELQTLMQTKHEQRMATRFSSLDSDGNGSVSLAEFQAAKKHQDDTTAANLFALLDVNKDDALSAEEMSVFKTSEGRALRKFAYMDSDGDGVISETEYTEQTFHKGGKRGHHGAKRCD